MDVLFNTIYENNSKTSHIIIKTFFNLSSVIQLFKVMLKSQYQRNEHISVVHNIIIANDFVRCGRNIFTSI